MKNNQVKCVIQYNLFTPIANDTRPEIGKIYTVIGIKHVNLKSTDKQIKSFRLKELAHNEVIQWFSAEAFEYGKINLDKIEFVTETI